MKTLSNTLFILLILSSSQVFSQEFELNLTQHPREYQKIIEQYEYIRPSAQSRGYAGATTRGEFDGKSIVISYHDRGDRSKLVIENSTTYEADYDSESQIVTIYNGSRQIGKTKMKGYKLTPAISFSMNGKQLVALSANTDKKITYAYVFDLASKKWTVNGKSFKLGDDDEVYVFKLVGATGTNDWIFGYMSWKHSVRQYIVGVNINTGDIYVDNTNMLFYMYPSLTSDQLILNGGNELYNIETKESVYRVSSKKIGKAHYSRFYAYGGTYIRDLTYNSIDSAGVGFVVMPGSIIIFDTDKNYVEYSHPKLKNEKNNKNQWNVLDYVSFGDGEVLSSMDKPLVVSLDQFDEYGFIEFLSMIAYEIDKEFTTYDSKGLDALIKVFDMAGPFDDKTMDKISIQRDSKPQSIYFGARMVEFVNKASTLELMDSVQCVSYRKLDAKYANQRRRAMLETYKSLLGGIQRDEYARFQVDEEKLQIALDKLLPFTKDDYYLSTDDLLQKGNNILVENPEESIIFYQIAASKEPENAVILASLAKAYQLSGETDKAKEYYKKAQVLEPKSNTPSPTSSKANTTSHAESKSYITPSTASKSNRKVDQNTSTRFDNQEKSEYANNVGGVLNADEQNMLEAAIGTYQSGDLEKAATELSQVIDKYPMTFWGYVYRSSVYGDQKKYDLAIADGKKAIKFYPQEPEGYIIVSAYMMLSNHYADARDYILHAFKIGQTYSFPVWANIGLYYWWKGDTDNAEYYLRKSVVFVGSKENYDGFVKEMNGEVAEGRLPANPKLIADFKDEFAKNGSKYIQYKNLDSEAVAFINDKKHYDAALKNNEIVDLLLTTNPPDYDLAMQYAVYAGNQFSNAKKTPEAKAAYLRSYDYLVKGNVANFGAAKMANSQGMFFKDEHDYLTAAKFYTKAISIFQEIGNQSWKGSTLSNLAEVEGFMGKNEISLKHNLEAIEIAKELGEKKSLAISYNNTSQVYENLGKYELALQMAKKSVQLGEELNHSSLSSFYSSLGNRYATSGDRESALVNYKKALELVRKEDNKVKMAQYLGSIGSTYYQMRNRDKAEEALRESVQLARESGSIIDEAYGYHNLGLLAKDLKMPYEAEEELKKALAIFRKYNMKREIAGDLLMLGKINSENFKKFQQAEKYYMEAKSIYEAMGLKYELSELYQSLAAFYAVQSKMDQAISYGEKGIAYYEETLLSGSNSISQLSSGIEQYELLAAYCSFSGKYSKAFDTIEKAKSRQLAIKLAGKNVKPLTTSDVSAKIGANTAMISYLNTGYGIPTYITITNNGSKGYMTRTADGTANGATVEQNFKSLLSKYEQKAKAAVMNQRGFKRIDGPKEKKISSKAIFSKEKFEELINYYRILIVNEAASGQLSAEREEISKGLYNYLIEPIKEQFSGKEELIIVPEGILGYLPFETLKAQDGSYLAENYSIQYIQSATVWGEINKRSYSANRKPMLAYGGAVYGGSGAAKTKINSEEDLINLRNQLKNSSSTDYSEYYEQLGISSWEPLPGTTQEVNNIKSIFANAEVNSGCKVSENSIKTYSDQGKLGNYKVLHFATHGVVIPEIPELSALVLSQNCNQSRSDGYLTYGEIEKLKIKADFVNLSACETGLGKIYGGEGVVGLTQSFLIAGAKSMSVSLWQVADESTMRFMTGLYSKAKDSNSYSMAMTSMKREFISGKHGEELKLPYYWAPFVFYGD